MKRILKWLENLIFTAIILPLLPFIIIWWLVELGKQGRGKK